jgi:23S rRNA (adenine2503-C2)-methyltransferase
MVYRRDVLPLQATTPIALARALRIPIEDARRIVSAVHRERLGEPMPAVRRTSRLAALSAGTEPRLAVISIQKSKCDPFVKLLFGAPDGSRFEAVRIPLEKTGRFSACVSSQVGCALGCVFCATGKLGLLRNLEAWEIVEQVRAIRRTLGDGQRVHGVVFQGMGEPLANADRVIEAIFVLTDPCAQALDCRNITVCTSGIPSGIRKLANNVPKVRLGLSVGSAIGRVRKSLMPITRAHAWSEVLDAAMEHACTTGLAPMWAVTLLDGINDSAAHAEALARAVNAFAERTSIRPRLTIVPYNSIGPDDPFKRSTNEDGFRAVLAANGVFAHKRYSGGSDVAAACGQLVARSIS